MKKSNFSLPIFSFAFLFIFISSHNLKSQWYSQNSGVNTELFSIFFVNQITGFACGFNGKVLKTTNGGNNWIVNTVIDTSFIYTSIYFTNPNTGYIAGRILYINPLIAFPKIIKTTNAGLTWTSLLNDSGYTLWSIYFLNDNTGFASGGLYAIIDGKLLKTTNEGVNWNLDTSFYIYGYLNSFSFSNASYGYITTYIGHIYKTTNSGIIWNHLSFVPINELYSIFFLNSNMCFAIGGGGPEGYGQIYKSLDGGFNWNLNYSDTLGALNTINFVNSSTGFCIGKCDYFGIPLHLIGRILKTTNSGNNWYNDSVFTNINSLSACYFTDQLTGYVVGSNGIILKTTTGGNPIGINPISKDIPKSFSLSQNYPNPFNPSTKINFSIPQVPLSRGVSEGRGVSVSLKIYDILGREVATLVNENLQLGTYEVEWDASNYPSGVYFYKLQTETYINTKKLVLLK